MDHPTPPPGPPIPPERLLCPWPHWSTLPVAQLGTYITQTHDPSTRPQTEFLCEPIREIMKEKLMTKNHGEGVIGGAIIEKRSLRRNHWKENPREELIEERGIWEASGRHPGGIREASGRHLGGIWEASGRHPP